VGGRLRPRLLRLAVPQLQALRGQRQEALAVREGVAPLLAVQGRRACLRFGRWVWNRARRLHRESR
jgi:hypothetical protein